MATSDRAEQTNWTNAPSTAQRRRYRRDSTIYYVSIILPILIYICGFGTFFVNNDSSSLHTGFGLTLFLLKMLWFTSIVLAATNLVGLVRYGSPLRQDEANVARLRRFGWNPRHKLIVVYVSRGDNHEALGRSLHDSIRVLNYYKVNYQIDVVTDLPVSDKLERYLKSHFHVVPHAYFTKRYARYKARALHYLVEQHARMKFDLKYRDVWVLHLDEESVLTSESIAGVAKFIDNKNHESTIGQGEIKYNSYGYGRNLLITAIDNVRTGDDLGRFRYQYKMLNRPIFGMHGSYILVPQAIERKLGFDLGGKGSITEDAYFALHASEKGYKFDWVEGYIREQSPFTLKAIMKQRRRWYCGLIFLSFDRELKLSTRGFLLLNMILWTVGWTGPLITIVIFLAPGSYSPLWLIVAAGLVQGSYGAVYMIGAYRGLMDVKFSRAKKAFIYLLTFFLLPFSSAVEGSAILYGIFRPVKTFDVVKK